ncbi:MAG: hypothetical protein K6E76_00565 [Patescibacteria group bacterium]|nr:hypothetical protein [Patescibacteria group bacterium]
MPHIVFRENTDGHRELQKLEDWVKNKYSSDYIKKENQLKERYYDKSTGLKEQYVKYELLLFCLQKYSEDVNQKHQNIIKEIYKDEDEYKKAMDKASNVFDKMQNIIQTKYQ